MSGRKSISLEGLLHLSVVYVVWGSTYLAIRYAVREGEGFEPFIMAGSRILIGGLALLVLARLLGQSIRIARGDLPVLALSAILLWNGGNGLVTWAEQHAHSGYAALVVGTTPAWGALIESIIDRRRPSLLLVVAILIGFTGLAVLTAPVMQHGARADVVSTLALLAAPISWSLGSILQQRRPHALPPMVSAGYQQLIGSVGFALLALGTGERWVDPSTEAWLAWGYLIVFGSILAFTSYVIALRKLPISIVMTYAYVNPVIAVALGWLLLDEPVSAATLGGTALILAGVGGVFHEKMRRSVPAGHGEAPARRA